MSWRASRTFERYGLLLVLKYFDEKWWFDGIRKVLTFGGDLVFVADPCGDNNGCWLKLQYAFRQLGEGRPSPTSELSAIENSPQTVQLYSSDSIISISADGLLLTAASIR